MKPTWKDTGSQWKTAARKSEWPQEETKEFNLKNNNLDKRITYDLKQYLYAEENSPINFTVSCRKAVTAPAASREFGRGRFACAVHQCGLKDNN